MQKYIYPILVILVAIVSVALSEVLLINWLNIAPFAITSSIFAFGVFPVQILLVGITTALLFKAYKFNAKIYMPLYAVVYIAAHAAELNSFNNPIQDIALYAVAILVACMIWFYIVSRFLRSTPST